MVAPMQFDGPCHMVGYLIERVVDLFVRLPGDRECG
jgi:hypothetical protein